MGYAAEDVRAVLAPASAQPQQQPAGGKTPASFKDFKEAKDRKKYFAPEDFVGNADPARAKAVDLLSNAAQLKGMGFEEARVVPALLSCGNDLRLTIDTLTK